MTIKEIIEVLSFDKADLKKKKQVKIMVAGAAVWRRDVWLLSIDICWLEKFIVILIFELLFKGVFLK